MAKRKASREDETVTPTTLGVTLSAVVLLLLLLAIFNAVCMAFQWIARLRREVDEHDKKAQKARWN